MKTKIKIFAVIGISAVLVLTLVVGGWFVTNVYAQGPTPNPNSNVPNGGCHNNQAVFDLLKNNAQDLLKERQAGKSLLDIATAKGVSEQQLTDALLQSVTTMHNWMGQNYPQSNVEQMTQYMREQTTKDIRQAQYGTMTDFRLFGGSGAGMMNGANGMMGGQGGMISGWNGSNNGSRGGMMGGGNGSRRGMMVGNSRGGMMGGSTY